MQKLIISMLVCTVVGEMHAMDWSAFIQSYLYPEDRQLFFSINDFCAQLDHDLELKYVPSLDRQCIIQKVKHTLTHNSQQRPLTIDIATQYSKAGIIDYVESNVVHIVQYLDMPCHAQAIVDNINENVQSDLNNNNTLAPYFSDSLAHTIQKTASVYTKQ